jgi:hypothetical protein
MLLLSSEYIFGKAEYFIKTALKDADNGDTLLLISLK